jgi:hypothetical protein
MCYNKEKRLYYVRFAMNMALEKNSLKNATSPKFLSSLLNRLKILDGYFQVTKQLMLVSLIGN